MVLIAANSICPFPGEQGRTKNKNPKIQPTFSEVSRLLIELEKQQ